MQTGSARYLKRFTDPVSLMSAHPSRLKNGYNECNHKTDDACENDTQHDLPFVRKWFWQKRPRIGGVKSPATPRAAVGTVSIRQVEIALPTIHIYPAGLEAGCVNGATWTGGRGIVPFAKGPCTSQCSAPGVKP